MMIRVICPHCDRTLVIERASHYICQQCRQVVEIERESERVAYYLDLADKFLEATR